MDCCSNQINQYQRVFIIILSLEIPHCVFACVLGCKPGSVFSETQVMTCVKCTMGAYRIGCAETCECGPTQTQKHGNTST